MEVEWKLKLNRNGSRVEVEIKDAVGNYYAQRQTCAYPGIKGGCTGTGKAQNFMEV